MKHTTAVAAYRGLTQQRHNITVTYRVNNRINNLHVFGLLVRGKLLGIFSDEGAYCWHHQMKVIDAILNRTNTTVYNTSELSKNF